MKAALRAVLILMALVSLLCSVGLVFLVIDIWQAEPHGEHLRMSGMVMYQGASPIPFAFLSLAAIVAAAVAWTVQQRLKS